MPSLVKIGTAAGVKSGTLVTVGGRDVVIFRQDDKFWAMSNVCAHQHISRLHEGKQDGCTIECPMHGWRYDIRSGISLTGQGRVAVYTVVVRGELLFVELPDER